MPIRWRCLHCCAVELRCCDVWRTLGGWWASKILFTRKRGASSTLRLKFALLSQPEVCSAFAFESRKGSEEERRWTLAFSFFPFREPCPDIFLSRALPAASCDSNLSLGSGVQSSELSRQSLAYPGPTERNLAWSACASSIHTVLSRIILVV